MFNERLRKPPIKEAIFSLIFQEEISLDIINLFSSREYITEKYPSKKPNIVIEHQMQSDSKVTILDTQEGIILDRVKDCGRLVKINKGNISFHIVNNYENWEKLIVEFKEICNELVSVFDQVQIKEVFVRYINHINIDEGDDIKEYFKLLPTEVEGLPKRMSNFFLQVKLPKDDLSGVITKTITKSTDGTIFFIIDLRVSKPFNNKLSSTSLWDSFEEVRAYKNMLFFSIITEKVKQKFS